VWIRFVGAVFFAFLFAAQTAAQTSEPQFAVVSDVEYCTGGGSRLLMDIFIPKNRNRTPTPAVL
jgi:hypothetical protein